MEFAFLSFVIFIIIATALGLVLMFISNFLGQKVKIVRKNDIYESGVNPVGSATRQYDIKFYLTAILFLLFDVEIVFLLPWALNYHNVANSGFMVAGFVFFMTVLLVGYIFVIGSKALKWEK
jgi:NADH-quinone oxidoreductase subunit A